MKIILLLIIVYLIWFVLKNLKANSFEEQSSSTDWQEEELKKRNKRKREVALSNQVVSDFWEELKSENEKLSPELRLVYQYDRIAKDNLSKTGDGWGGISIEYDNINIGGPIKIKAPFLCIYYNLSKETLELECSDDDKYSGLYKIDENSARILIRNLCQHNVPYVFGLKQR
ncbi:MAG: hypothetical protein HGB06_10990 [Chlorobaculum sp.]|nr:hypothetical protein [Chlorobaculum sp.]